LQIRVDMDQDGYYQGGGLEDWHLLPDQEDSTLCRTVTELQFTASGSPRFELRARAGFGELGVQWVTRHNQASRMIGR
jgi:hypothetical protein